MHAQAARVNSVRRSGRRGGLLAGAGGAALTLALLHAAPARAEEYLVANDAQLRAAITAANANADPSATIVLTGSFALANTGLPLITKPITIDTRGFALSGNVTNSPVVRVVGPYTTGSLTLDGAIVGATAGVASTTTGGSGLNITGGAIVTNNATVTGGAGGQAGGVGGRGAAVLGTGSTLVNYGTITAGTSYGAGSTASGVQVTSGGVLVNNGVIQGSSNPGAFAAPAVELGNPTALSTLINNGVIRGGSGGSSNVGLIVRANNQPIINTGTIEGGAGSAAVSANTMTLINSGALRAGAGQATALLMSTGQLTLELRSGSVIQGDVVASTTQTDDILRLGGATDATFDVSAIGAAGQYRNLDVFQKTGASTWTLTGTGTATTDWDIQQGALQIGDGGASGSIIGNVSNAGVLAFNRSDALTYGGIVSGTGSVRQIGTGTTTLTGVNTYSGGTAIDAGVLRISGDANLGAIAGGLDFNGGTLNTTATLTTARAVTLTGAGTLLTDAVTILRLDGDITGAGGLTKSGAGSLLLTGNATHSGGTTITAGNLQVGNGGATGSIAGDIVNNGVLTFQRGDGYTYGGGISGTGDLAQVGGGTLTLTGNSSYGGATTVGAGELRIAGGNTVSSGDDAFVIGGVLSVDGSVFGATGLLAQSQAGIGATVNVQNGGVLRTTADDLQLRSSGAGPALVSLDIAGAGSLADVAGGLLVGASNLDDIASATLSAGGVLRTAGASRIGAATTGNTIAPLVTITGAGSNWVSTSTLAMTNGTFSVSDGGAASFTAATIGSVSTAFPASVMVSGTDSRFTTTGDFTVGSGVGTGVVTLAEGGLLDVGGSLALADNAGATGVLNIGGGESLPATAAGSLNSASVSLGSATSRVNFNHTDPAFSVAALISGSGAVNQVAGTTILTADNSYSGATTVSGGILRINGDQSAATGLTSVLSGGALGGGGVVGGDVMVADGGTLAPGNSPGTLTIAGDLTLSNASLLDFEFGQSNVVGGPLNDLIVVNGDLTLDGAIDATVTAGGSFGAGVYRVISYVGALTDNGLSVGSMPPGSVVGVQTSVAGQVNLINSAGATVNFWDGAAGPKLNGFVNGGAGVWQANSGNDNWTDITGNPNAGYANGSLAVFMAASGTVTVDDALGAVTASGLQFATGGYTIIGDDIALVGPQSAVRVGDGTAAGAAMTATIGSALTGATQLVKTDLGTLVLTGANSYTGGTRIDTGTLLINGDQSLATGATSVAATAALGGAGVIGGSVDMVAGGFLAPGSNGAGTLTINGDLTLGLGSQLAFELGQTGVAGGALNDLVEVGGNLTLDGTVNVAQSAGGSFDVGIYRLFNYAGALTNNGLLVGAQPAGAEAFVQTSVAGQVNLVNVGGLDLSFWDGAAGPKFDSVINGGDGVWQAHVGNDNWTDANGALNAGYSDGAVAVFAGAAGTVTISNTLGPVIASAMQFATGGYTITGDPLTLTGAQATIRVGDGSAAGAGYTATIATALTGASQLVKTDLGTLVLLGANTYTGGTRIDGGALAIGNGGATGGLTGDIVNNAALVVNRTGALTLNGAISGSGSLTKLGGGELILTGLNSYAGGTTVGGGAVRVSSDANLGAAAGALSLQGGTLRAGASFTSGRAILLGSPTANGIDTQGFDVTLGGVIGDGAGNAGGNFLDKVGSGTLTLTGANTYGNRTNLVDGTLALAGAGTIGIGNLVIGAGAVFDISQTTLGARVIQVASTPTSTIALGSKMLRLGLVNSSSGWTGTITDGGLGGGTGGRVMIDALIGTVSFHNANSYTGGTLIAAGTFALSGNGSLYSGGAVAVNPGTVFDISGLTAAGTTIGDLSGAGALSLGGKSLTFGTANDTSYTGAITGNGGGLVKAGAGTFTLASASSYTGATTVAAGTLLVNGNQSAATGLTTVASGATLGGSGRIGGDVIVADGGALAPGNSPGALTINGSLTLSGASTLAYELGAANAVGSPLNDLVNVGGNLTLDGAINVAVSPGGSFGIGLYRVANYGGVLTDNGLAIGATPAGADLFVQTSVANQVNLVNTAGVTLNFWDGAAGPKFNNAVNGGDGVWQASAGGHDWTDPTGAVNAGYSDGAFAIFSGTPGLVTIDNGVGAVTASGLQFASNGYTVAGGALTLTGPQSVVRVGDGSAMGMAYTATISAQLAGDTQLVKTDAGTLVLTGANSFNGGVAINGGRLRISSDANLGAVAGGLSFNGGTLDTTADISSGRAVELAGQGVFSTNTDTTLTLAGAVSGPGALVKNGLGTLVLSGSGGHTGGTSVNAGTLLVNGDNAAATGLTDVASGATLGGGGVIGGDVRLASGATLSPGAGGAGTLTIGGGLTLASGTQLVYELGQANVAGGALNDLVEVGGDLTLDGAINVTAPTGGAFGAGVYRLFNYGGALTDNGLTLGALPASGDVAVQTSIAGQVNLVNFAGGALNFWDGAAGSKNDGAINGGAGTWQVGGGSDSWTDAGGAVNAAYADGALAVFGGVGGVVTVDNGLGQVTVAGLQFATDGYTITGGAIALGGAQATIRVGDGSVAGAGYTATVASALSGAAQLVKTDAGTLVLGGANSYAGGTLISGGVLQISSDANLGAAAGGVTLDGGTLATNASVSTARGVVTTGAGAISTASDTTLTLAGPLTGAGTLTKMGGGRLLLTGDGGAHAGGTVVGTGTLQVDGVLGGATTVATAGRLEGVGRVGSVVNLGAVAPGGEALGTLTLTGGYAGDGGTLEIATTLGGDASPTDRLVVQGDTSGSTEVVLTNRGGLGGQTVEGVKIIDIAGASTGVFTLRGDYQFQGSPAVIAGAYGYRLYKGGVATPADGDWYLRSALLAGDAPQAPLYQPGVPVYETYGQTMLALNALGTMQQRIGERQWGTTQNGERSGLWGRVQANRYRPNAAVSTSLADFDVDSWNLEFGADRVLSEREDATLVLGVLAGFGEAKSEVDSVYGDGSIKTKDYSAGATLSWYGPRGYYVDGQVRATWFDSDLRSTVLGALADGNDGHGQAYSVEIGKRSPISAKLSFTPQVQMVYSTVGFDRFVDPNGAEVASGRGESLKTRWGLAVNRDDAGSHLYAVGSLNYEWLEGTLSNVSGTPIARANNRLWGELGVGGTVALGNLRLYTEASADTAISDFGHSYSVKGTMGLRLAF